MQWSATRSAGIRSTSCRTMTVNSVVAAAAVVDRWLGAGGGGIGQCWSAAIGRSYTTTTMRQSDDVTRPSRTLQLRYLSAGVS